MASCELVTLTRPNKTPALRRSLHNMQVREDEDFTLSCYGCKEISTTMTEGSKWFLGRLVYVMRSIDYRWLHLQYEEIYQSENLKKVYLASCLLEKNIMRKLSKRRQRPKVAPKSRDQSHCQVCSGVRFASTIIL